MKDEINKIIQSISDFYKLDNALKYYLDRHKAQILLDYITNLQTIEQQYSDILSENAELRIQISAREEEYIKLQEENEYSNHCNEELRKKITNLEYKIERLKEDNKNLKELCNKYEEEHKTTFEEWKKDIQIINKLQEWLEENYMCEVLTKLNKLKEK